LKPISERLVPYNLDNPDEKYLLPGYLEEVSGISYMDDGRIACVEDERGIIYIFDPQTGEIDQKYTFGEKGDYEDIVVEGRTAYILRYDGVIFEVEDFNSGEGRVEANKTALSKKNDTEGMAYDKQTHSLLIACKGSPSLKKGDDYEDQKAIYCFDLSSKELSAKPKYLFDLNRVWSYKDQDVFRQLSQGPAKAKKIAKTDIKFHSSGISIHPLYFFKGEVVDCSRS